MTFALKSLFSGSWKAVAFGLALGVALVGRTQAQAQAVPFGAYDVHSAFYVAKSENQNQVHYGVRLDAQCRPLQDAPVFAYWRRLRAETRVDEPLEGMGVYVYGASDEQEVRTTATGSIIALHVKALKRVPIEIEVTRTDSGCTVVPYLTLQGERARLSYAFVQLGPWGLRPRYVEVVASRERDGAEIRERFR